MLIDPENVEEWEFQVRAADINVARKKCEEIAANQLLTEVLSVTQATMTPYNGTYQFICWFRSEATDDDNNNGSDS
jgi:hypothetical protein